MDNSVCVGGDGGPLIVLQASAVPLWQGAMDFENSLMGGGDVETDYDVNCESVGADGFCVIPRYGREMLVLWDSSYGARVLPSEGLSCGAGALVLTICFHADDMPDFLPRIQERIAQGKPERSLSFDIQDTSLRLQVGADGGAFHAYKSLEIPVVPSVKQCDVYLVEHDSLTDMVVVI